MRKLGHMTEQADIDWIPAGTVFGVDDMTFYQDKGVRPIDQVLGDIDLVVTGPHATGAFPAEMEPFVDVNLTRRLQYDFTDVSTSPMARRWAQIDPHTLYIENPHPRAVRDANRPRPVDLLSSLKDAFGRLAADPGGRPSLAKVDAVRPVTFGYLPVLRCPTDDVEWAALVEALTTAMAGGVDRYETLRDDLIAKIVDAKLAKLATLDPTTCSPAQWNSATHLDVLSIHDTMNHTARPDGAVCLERQPNDRLPNVVALSNRGDSRGEMTESDATTLRDEISIPSMEPARLRSIGYAYRQAFDAWEPDDVGFNRPYLGGHETQVAGPRLRALASRAAVRLPGAKPASLSLGAYQNEFLREFLLGDATVELMMQPGATWHNPPDDRIEWLAERLKAAHDLIREHGTQLDPR